MFKGTHLVEITLEPVPDLGETCTNVENGTCTSVELGEVPDMRLGDTCLTDADVLNDDELEAERRADV